MDLSLTTDFVKDTGCPGPYLKMIAEHGFTHVHWCHHWNTDFIYSRHEIRQIKKWLGEYELRLLDLHGSDGDEKKWYSGLEYERLAGVELVKNRIEMTAELGGSSVVMHHGDGYSDSLRKSLDELEVCARKNGVRIAVENGEFDIIEHIFADYPPDYVGLCLDSGHANLIREGNGLMRLDKVKDRLIAQHLHDNDGGSDQHNIIFTGTIDWGSLSKIIAESSYRLPVSSEANIKGLSITEDEFLNQAYAAGEKLHKMIEVCRNNIKSSIN